MALAISSVHIEPIHLITYI